MKMNVKLLRRIQKHILAEPKRYWQSTWLARKKSTGSERLNYEHIVERQGEPACGTVACIAGWAVLLENPSLRITPLSVGRVAQRLLGLDETQAGALFGTPIDWPGKYGDAYRDAKTPRGRARVAVNRISHFIKTKGAE